MIGCKTVENPPLHCWQRREGESNVIYVELLNLLYSAIVKVSTLYQLKNLSYLIGTA